jgi:hypothetical protein
VIYEMSYITPCYKQILYGILLVLYSMKCLPVSGFFGFLLCLFITPSWSSRLWSWPRPRLVILPSSLADYKSQLRVFWNIPPDFDNMSFLFLWCFGLSFCFGHHVQQVVVALSFTITAQTTTSWKFSDWSDGLSHADVAELINNVAICLCSSQLHILLVYSCQPML